MLIEQYGIYKFKISVVCRSSKGQNVILVTGLGFILQAASICWATSVSMHSPAKTMFLKIYEQSLFLGHILRFKKTCNATSLDTVTRSHSCSYGSSLCLFLQLCDFSSNVMSWWFFSSTGTGEAALDKLQNAFYSKGKYVSTARYMLKKKPS